ncbi:hypothetical protein, partial [Bradyrhizobium sp.]|uniref:hypothetical protein n=1 Tax=Bradyrhizobium sp. TaxID=376 RepID=UPI003C5D065D
MTKLSIYRLAVQLFVRESFTEKTDNCDASETHPYCLFREGWCNKTRPSEQKPIACARAAPLSLNVRPDQISSK